MLDKAFTYVMTQGPWAVVCLALGWLWLRTRKEAMSSIKELSGLVAEKEGEIRGIEEARRKEALELQAKSYETISQLVQLMDKVREVLDRVVNRLDA